MVRITGCVVVKDEADLLAGCLRSLAEFCDEIIVVDNGSSDDTAAVASASGAVVISDTDSEFELLRNKAIEHASSTWIMELDADERMESGELLRTSAEQVADEVSGFVLPCLDYIGDGRWNRAKNAVRFYRRHEEVRHNESVHSSVAKTALAVGKLEHVYAPIQHLDAIVSAKTVEKRYRNEQRLLASLRDQPSDWKALCMLGLEYIALERYEEARECLEGSRRHATARADITLVDVFLCTLLLVSDRPDRAREYAESVLSSEVSNGFRSKLLAILAEIHVREGDRETALAHCQESLRLWPHSPDMHVNVAALVGEHDPELARSHLLESVRLNPYVLKPMIYRRGFAPNLYDFQVTFLTGTRTLPEAMPEYCGRTGRRFEEKEWTSFLERVRGMADEETDWTEEYLVPSSARSLVQLRV